MTGQLGVGLDEARADRELWGRLVESAVGAHLANAASVGTLSLAWWREGDREVDFVVRRRSKVAAIEVKSGRHRAATVGLDAFARRFGPTRSIVVGPDGIALDRFLLVPPERWIT
jgi:predicted AAA+ superfamily ATPase